MLLFLFVCTASAYLLPTEPIHIKKKVQTNTENVLKGQIRPPAVAEGPLAAFSKDLECIVRPISFESETFSIKVCLYDTVSISINDANYDILGIWKGWEVQNGMYKYLVFDDGNECNQQSELRTSIRLKVSIIDLNESPIIENFQIINPETCEYVAELGIPADPSIFEGSITSPGVLLERKASVPEETEIVEERMVVELIACDLTPLAVQLEDIKTKVAEIQHSLNAEKMDEYLYQSTATLVQLTSTMLNDMVRIASPISKEEENKREEPEREERRDEPEWDDDDMDD